MLGANPSWKSGSMRIPALPIPLVAILAAALLSACAAPEKKDEEPSKDTFECTLRGDRYVIRFTEGEARVLTPDANRIILYQIAAASGVRYTNGMIELRGKGTELQLVQDGFARTLDDCKPVMVPKQEPTLFERMMPQPQRSQP
jgi:membrane-bound inhibitor of C-type lysozyme